MHVQTVAPAGGELRLGKGDAHACRADVPDVVEQAAPAATEVEDPSPGGDPDLLSHVLVLAALSLLEGQREVAVVLRPAEIRELAQAQTDDAVGQRVAEIDVLLVSHGCPAAI